VAALLGQLHGLDQGGLGEAGGADAAVQEALPVEGLGDERGVAEDAGVAEDGVGELEAGGVLAGLFAGA
jgi:hypothetical protein